MSKDSKFHKSDRLVQLLGSVLARLIFRAHTISDSGWSVLPDLTETCEGKLP